MKAVKQVAILFAVLAVVWTGSPYALGGNRFSGQQDADSKTASGSSTIPAVLPKGKKLILTDGTYQLAREYTVEGDRVRYWSVERSQWEEIPVQLVDWDATHKDEAAQSAHDAELKAKIHATELADRTRNIDVDLSLEIKPGLFLPDGVGFYALDTNKRLLEMKQNHSVSKAATSREIEKVITKMPIIPSKQTLQIPGERATLRLKSAEPEFFMRPADTREPRFRLLRARVKGGRRVLEDLSTYFSGKQGDNGIDIGFQTWTPASGVFRYTVEQRLEPGEYAFIELTDEGISAYVWDFGIDPSGK
jgi:hypothetical protein